MSNARNPILDIMKGIGILLMLVGHIPPGDKMFLFIYSFHMPLFFIVAGYLAKPLNFAQKAEIINTFKADFRRLVLPMIVTMLMVIVLSPLHYFIDHSFKNILTQIVSLLWAGESPRTSLGSISIDSMWFLMGLFWCRWLFRTIEYECKKLADKWREIAIVGVCAVVSVVWVYFKQQVCLPLPWGIGWGISALVFYAVGWLAKRHSPQWYLLSLFVVVWVIELIKGDYVMMVHYAYGCYPLDVIGAIGATWLVYLASRWISKYLPNISKMLQWCGINSLAILCINTLDRKTYLVRAIKYVLGIHLVGTPSVFFHYGIEMLILIVIISLPIGKKVFGIKRIKEM